MRANKPKIITAVLGALLAGTALAAGGLIHTADLNEIQQAVAKADADGKDVHVVVEAGGASEWQYEPMKNHDYGRFCVTGKDRLSDCIRRAGTAGRLRL